MNDFNKGLLSGCLPGLVIFLVVFFTTRNIHQSTIEGFSHKLVQLGCGYFEPENGEFVETNNCENPYRQCHH